MNNAEKKILSEAKDNLIVSIPLVVRLRPIVIQPRLAVIVAIHIEHVRIAVRVGFVCHAIYSTAYSIRYLAKGATLYFIWNLKSTSTAHQIFSF
ncbi:MAG: hypothetical protein A2271_04510 [Candidatus Moranbacteria bacterium RIFOXYA12_FULL_35_19]|nr:MAG: hypothetical protein A2343_00575 [Candidatus Moranbacteria bacterium RIFOXYB12_FULL_35_8]OGI35703.1 MAG: hypothetical protein A2271_04510 [Candidatus Moranbacteria bacterium RIFOXYA12_FULL_35_19]